MIELNRTTQNPQATASFGEALGACMLGGDVVLLEGPMGAGKTHFAKGIARGLSVVEDVTSPTFTLIAEYHGRLPLIHMDLYRLYRNPEDHMETLTYDQLFEIGFEDYLDGDRVVLIEWAHGVQSLLDDYLDIRLDHAGGDSSDDHTSDPARTFAIRAHGSRSTELLKEWMAQ